MPANPPAFDDALFRQRERTIDNIKRIYAVVYSISFTYILRDIFVYGQHWMTGSVPKGFSSGLQVRLLMLLVFASTVSVFAYQADKFLDLRYTLRPAPTATVMPYWHKWDFAIDAGSLILTLIPFTMMSYAFTDELVDRYGIIPFFVSYLVLLGLSVGLLLVVRLKYILFPPAAVAPRNANGELPEEARYATLSVHWFVTNGTTMLVLTLLFSAAAASRLPCGTSLRPPLSWFAGAFLIIAMLRNVVDFRAVWPFLYANTRVLTEADLTPMARYVSRSPHEAGFTCWDLTGVLAVLVFLFALFVTLPALAPGSCPAVGR